MYFRQCDVLYMRQIITLISKTPSVTPNNFFLGIYKLRRVNMWDIWFTLTITAFCRFYLNKIFVIFLTNLFCKVYIHL